MKKWYFFIVFLIMIIILPMSISADCGTLGQSSCSKTAGCEWVNNSCKTKSSSSGGNNNSSGGTSCGVLGQASCSKNSNCEWVNNSCKTKGSSSGGNNNSSGGTSCGVLGQASCSKNSNCEWINNSCKTKGSSTGGGNSGSGNTGSGNTGGSSGGNTGGSNGSAGTGYNGFDCEKCYNDSYTNTEKRGCLTTNGCSIDESRLGNTGGSKSKNGQGTNYDSGDDKLNDLHGCEAVFGKIDNGKFVSKNSLGYFIQSIFNIVKYVVPIILIVLTVVEFLQAVTSGDKDNITKALKKTYTRLIIVVIIFLVPTILNLLLSFVTENGTCGIK